MSSTTRICSSDAFSASAVARIHVPVERFERLAMMITNLTRFFSESPELFRLSRMRQDRQPHRALLDIHHACAALAHLSNRQVDGLDSLENRTPL
jgi:hypothetical protein